MSNTDLIQFNQLPEIVANATVVLEKNTKRLQHVINKGQELLDTIEAEGMSPELDAACNEYMGGVSKLKSMANELRSPITQMLAIPAKTFTSIENQMDKDKPDTIPFRIQSARNEHARNVAAEQRRKELELRNKQLADGERIEITAKVELKVRERYNEVLFGAKRKYNDLFNTMTLDNIQEVKFDLNKMPMDYPRDSFNKIAVAITSVYIQQPELAGLIFDTRAGLYDELSANFRENMEAHKLHLLDQIPARTYELEEMSKAGKAEQKRLKEQAELRQKEEEIRLAKENQKREQEALDAAKLSQEVGAAQLSFEKDIAVAEIMADQTASVKKGYIIKVLTNTGWMQIINLWFKEFGSKTTVDKIATKKPESMKADLEKLALNSGTRLDDSAHLVYEEDIKALTKKI